MLAITSIYVRYLLPMMVEIQWWDYHEPTRSADERRADAVTAPLQWARSCRRVGSSSTRGWSAADAWERTKELAQLAEQLGYDHLWVYDHVETVPRREPTHVFEAFTTLAALAQHTSTIKLGQMVTCAAYRNAGLLAKEAACVDVFSGGRLILGIGAGWYEREYQAYGYPVPERRDPAADPRGDGRGRRSGSGPRRRSPTRASTSTFDGAYCDPKPIQQLPELWIGGGGEKVTLRIEARHADKTNWQIGLDAFVRKSELLRGYCDEIGRDFDSIVRTHGPDCRVFDTEADLQRVARLARRRLAVGRRRSRRVRARQLRRHRRAGRREGAGVRRRRMSRVRAVVPRLPVVGEPRSGRARRRAAGHGSERVAALGFAPVTALSDAPARPSESDVAGRRAGRRRARRGGVRGRRRRRPRASSSTRGPSCGSTRRCRSTSRGCRSRDLHDALKHDGAPPLYYLLLHVWTGAVRHGQRRRPVAVGRVHGRRGRRDLVRGAALRRARRARGSRRS